MSTVNGFLVGSETLKYNYESLDNYNTPNFSTSSSKTYAVGDYVMYNGKLYKCTTATTGGTWVSGNWAEAVLSDDVSDLNRQINHYLVNIYQKTFVSSGSTFVNYALTAGEKYVLRNVSESTAVALLKNNAGNAGSTIIAVNAGETIYYTAQESMPNFFLYRNSSVSVEFSISQYLTYEKVEALESEVNDINDAIVGEKYTKTFRASGFNVITTFPLQANIEYKFTLESEGNDVGIYKNNGGELGNLLFDLHTPPTDVKYYTPTENLSDFIIYRASATTCTITIETVTIPIRVENLENAVQKIPPQPTYVTVKKDGTGDFTTIRGAVDSINNASVDNPYCILVYEGIYNVLEDFTDEEIRQANVPESGYNENTFVGIKLTDGISIKGIGAKEKIILKGELDPDAWEFKYRRNISTLNLKGNCNVENLTITGSQLRYCLHDDFAYNPSGSFNRLVKDVVFIPYSVTNGISYGCGFSGGAMYGLFDNVDFGNTLGIHSNPNRQPSSIVIHSCKGVLASFTDMGSECNIYMNNNSFDVISESDETSDHVQKMFLHGVGNENATIICPNGFVYETGSVTKVWPGGRFEVGKIVRKSATQYSHEYELATIPVTADGIVIFKNTDYVYIQKKGVFTSQTVPSIAGLQEGDLLTIDANSFITATGATQANAVAVVVNVDANNVVYAKILI